MATATPHVVRIEDVGKHVCQVVEAMNAKFWAINKRGHFIEMPEEISFEMIALVEFEALESSDKQISITSQIDGGFSTETTKTTSSDSQTSKEDKTSRATNIHNNSGSSTETFKQQ